MPYQNVLLPTLIKTSNDLRNRSIDLIINPDHFNKASGDIFYDMDQVEIVENNDYTYIKIFFSGYSIYFNQVNHAFTPYENYTDNVIENIKIFRAQNVIAQIGFKITFAEIYENNGNFSIYNIYLDKEKDEIIIKDLFKEIDQLKVINLR